jgi:hypothetical protein
MTGEEEQLPSACRKVLAEISSRNENAGATSESLLDVSDLCTLHIFVESIHWNNGEPLPEDAAFSSIGLSARAAGGAFPQLAKEDLKAQMKKCALQTKKTFVGVVAIPTEKIRADKTLRVFKLEHDPFPYYDGKDWCEQDSNHVQIVCKKNTDRRERLQKSSDWSIHPDVPILKVDFGMSVFSGVTHSSPAILRKPEQISSSSSLQSWQSDLFWSANRRISAFISLVQRLFKP